MDQIESSLVPSATGLTLDDEGYLWASDNINGKIYKIDPDGTGITEGDVQGISDVTVVLSPNPFSGILTVTGIGFGSAVDITIYDSAGRIVRTAQTEGFLAWTGEDGSGSPLPDGIYTILVSDEGAAAMARAVFLR